MRFAIRDGLSLLRANIRSLIKSNSIVSLVFGKRQAVLHITLCDTFCFLLIYLDLIIS